MITEALQLAIRAHDGQFREKSELPYIVHPMAVMSRLQSWGLTEKRILAAALLHDVLEDCGEEFRDGRIPESWGVWSIVEELTFRPEDGSKEDYCLSFNKKSIGALLIKVADRLCNCVDMSLDWDKEETRAYFEKGAPFFKAVWARDHEIAKFFGENVLLRIQYDIEGAANNYNAPIWE